MGRLLDEDAVINAINALHEKPNAWLDCAVDAVKDLQSAQPVLTCKGCKYDYYEYAGCRNCLRRERDLYEPE